MSRATDRRGRQIQLRTRADRAIVSSRRCQEAPAGRYRVIVSAIADIVAVKTLHMQIPGTRRGWRGLQRAIGPLSFGVRPGVRGRLVPRIPIILDLARAKAPHRSPRHGTARTRRRVIRRHAACARHNGQGILGYCAGVIAVQGAVPSMNLARVLGVRSKPCFGP